MTAILEMKGITKRFPGVIALRDVNLSVREGEIHAICGENGAGKSTLMKVLSGVYPHRLLRGPDPLRRRGAPLLPNRRQRAHRHHHHPSGTCAGAPAFDRREHLPRQRAGQERRYRLERVVPSQSRADAESGPQGIAQYAHHQHRRRQAATGRDRQGAFQEGQAAHPRRADGEPQRGRQRRAAQSSARVQGARPDLDPHFAQAQ